MIKINCEYCGKQTLKYQKDINKSKHHYCSGSCSNRAKPRRKPEGLCKDCNQPIKAKCARCKKCDSLLRANNIDTKSISDTLREGSNRYGNIRDRARQLYGHLKYIGCQVCHYNKHVDICHIKDISKFPKTTIVKIVNSQYNIVLLCKNCHWEFDNEILDIGNLNIKCGAPEKI